VKGRPTTALPTTHPSGATEVHLAMTENVMAEALAVLLPDVGSREPERGVIGLVHVSSGRRRRTLLLRRIITPASGDVTFDSHRGLLFSASYKSRATDAAAADRAGLIFLHTHPVRPGREHLFPHPSPEDLASDPRDLFALGRSLTAGVPLAAGIVSDTARWSVREYTFSFPSMAKDVQDPRFGVEGATITYASALRIVGPGLRKLPTSVVAQGPAGAEGTIAFDAQDSTVRLWGQSGQRALASLRVGHCGAGGVGGILSEHTARLGVGEGIYFDYDRLTFENFNRSQGATRDEAQASVLKAHVSERIARASATAPSFDARAVVGSVVEADTTPDLLDCDIILDGADSPWARQVLDHLAFAHLIPVIHGGTVLKGDPITGRVIAGKSEVSTTGPGHPCSECAGVYSLRDVTEAQEHPSARGHRRYLDVGNSGSEVSSDRGHDDDVRGPSVIALNAIVAGLMQLRLLAIFLGTTPQALLGTQRYHVLEGTMDWALVKSCRSGCRRPGITALGDSYELPTGVDLDYVDNERRAPT
jgi:molybdopterin-synthase adenylyltransferase